MIKSNPQGKHTPGPLAPSIGGTKQAVHIYERSSGDVLAVIPSHNCNRDNYEANAQLIAAAPELLEALDKAVRLLWSEHCEHVANPDREEFFKREDIKELMKAIAKAEGE